MLLLVPAFVGLFYVALAEPGTRSLTKRIAHQVLAALQDPLTLFSQRSPGMRLGSLLSTKGKSGPHERVLSTVRDREPPPTPENFLPISVTSVPIVPPAYEGLPTDHTLGSLPFVPPPSFIPSGFIPGGFSPPSGTPPEPPGEPPPGGPPPGGPPPGEPPPGGPPPGEPPPGGPPPGEPPPGTPPLIPIPEPSSWTFVLFGIFAVAAARRVRKPQTVRRR